MKCSRRLWKALILLLMCNGHLFSQLARDTPEATPAPVSVLYSLAWDTVSSGEPIVVTIYLQNRSEEAVYVDLGQGQEDGIQMTVTMPNGQTMTARPSNKNRSPGGYVTPARIALLDQGSKMKKQILLDDWYTDSGYGIYRINIRLANRPVRLESGSISFLNSDYSIEFRVVPRDPNVIKERCERLERAVLDGIGQDKFDAAFVLGRISDSEAIPYLKKMAFVDDSFARLAVSGLERIGSPTAILALRELSTARSSLLAGDASSAVVRAIKK